MRIRLLVPALAAVAAVALVTLASPVAPRAGAAPESWRVDPAHSFLLFRHDHMGAGTIHGRFNSFEGTVSFDAQNPSASTVSVEVKTESVDTGNAGRDEHLRKPDFFDTTQFPTMSFKSTSVKGSAKALEVTGDLTMHGVTKPVTVKLNVRGPVDFMSKKHIGFEGSFEIDRIDWKIGKAQGDTKVGITLSIECDK